MRNEGEPEDADDGGGGGLAVPVAAAAYGGNPEVVSGVGGSIVAGAGSKKVA